MSKKDDNNLSGESISLAFVGLGLIYGYVIPKAFSEGTPYVASAMILLGLTFFLVELQKRFNNAGLRWDNGGIGLFLGVISGYLTYLTYTNLSGAYSALIITLLSIMLLLSMAALIDFVVSIFEHFVAKEDITGRLTGLLKFVALIASTVAAVYAAFSQVIT